MASNKEYFQSPRERLQEHIRRALVEQLSNSSIDWTGLDTLKHPVLRIEACLEERPAEPARQATPGLLVSHVVDLADIAQDNTTCRIATPSSPDAPPGAVVAAKNQQNPGVILPVAHTVEHSVEHADLTGGPVKVASDALISPTSPTFNSDGDGDDGDELDEPASPAPSTHRQGLGGLRPARSDATTVQTEPDSQRQIQSGDRFPKRRKLKPVGHFLKPSTLDKLITGIWEQVHGDTNSDPRSLLEPLQLKPMSQIDSGAGGSKLALARAPYDAGGLDKSMASGGGGSFSRSNAFCRQVTQASRACRSLEVIVQARWVELFEEYVDGCAAASVGVSRTKHNKAALLEACADFGWSEKELRNKMYVWRGYKEIKDAGGWAALIFSGMGIYRFCKYRIGFDHDSMQRLRGIRPALEVAVDTLHPNWRQLLSVVGEPTQRVYGGHPHDWVVCFDGSEPVPLATTYFQWDPSFSYRQLDESVIDQAAWGCDDPRWTPPPVAVMRGTALPICETCGKEQSDDANRNNCYCFPSMFGCAKTNPSPVMVFHTPDGRNNGLIALCGFERGAPVGEFVGLVTKGFQDVDVMESSTALEKYQIWQGRQGNFTRFVNHSCKANAQYQRFTWMNTQRVVLVSKGIEAGSEITVDYSEKYWRGLDKACLCGESCCKYRRSS